jgi:hypothetical protein
MGRIRSTLTANTFSLMAGCRAVNRVGHRPIQMDASVKSFRNPFGGKGGFCAHVILFSEQNLFVFPKCHLYYSRTRLPVAGQPYRVGLYPQDSNERFPDAFYLSKAFPDARPRPPKGQC